VSAVSLAHNFLRCCRMDTGDIGKDINYSWLHFRVPNQMPNLPCLAQNEMLQWILHSVGNTSGKPRLLIWNAVITVAKGKSFKTFKVFEIQKYFSKHFCCKKYNILKHFKLLKFRKFKNHLRIQFVVTTIIANHYRISRIKKG